MKTLDTDYELFGIYPEPVRTIAILTYEITLPIADNSKTIIAYLSVIGLFVNFFHIFILSKKSMRQSSVNVLMIGQSISDIICFLYKTIQIPVVKDFLVGNGNMCDPPNGYIWVFGTFSYYYLDTICRRVSPWIGVVMAAFRFLISCFPFSNAIGKLGDPIASLCSMLILFVISTILSVPFYMQRTVTSRGLWVPKERCGYPANYSLPNYGIADKYEEDMELSDVFLDWTAVFVNLPPILLPFLTIGLIMVLKKHEKKRAQLSGNSKEVTRHNTTKLVVIMTVCLMITEVPFRITDTIEVIEYAAMLISDNCYESFQIFFLLNSIAHCFINMMLSSEYRKCVKDLVPRGLRSESTQSGNSRSTRNTNSTNSTRIVTTRMT